MRMLRVTNRRREPLFINLSRVAAISKEGSGGTIIFFSMVDGGSDSIAVKEKFEDVLMECEDAETVDVNVSYPPGERS